MGDPRYGGDQREDARRCPIVCPHRCRRRRQPGRATGGRLRRGPRHSPELRELRGPPGRSGDRSRLRLAAELVPSPLDDERPRGRQARAVREAVLPPERGGRDGLRRRRGARAGPHGGVHVAPHAPGPTAPRGAARDRRAADDPLDVQLRDGPRREHPARGGPRRWRADGRRLLLRQRVAAARRRGARSRVRLAGHRADRRRHSLHRSCCTSRAR